jgi:hypothetical protein
MRIKASAFCFAMVVLTIASSSSVADYIYNFHVFNSSACENVANLSFAVEAFDLGNQVKFDFRNNSTINSMATRIYFDSGSSLKFDHITNDPEIIFRHISSELQNLPAHNMLNPDFQADEVFFAREHGKWGMGPGGETQIVFNLSEGVNFKDVITGLDSGRDIRIGLFIQSFYTLSDLTQYSSASAVTTPEPSTVCLLGLGVLGLIKRLK